MIEELIGSIWANTDFHSSALSIRAAWLRRVLTLEPIEAITDLDLVKCVQAATILANSTDAQIQRTAFSIAACASDLRSEDMPGLNGALRIVLTRLGNFPAVNTSAAVSGFSRLPTRIAVSEQLRRDGNEVKVGQEVLTLTDFQRVLWDILSTRSNASISAPTSAGKSYVLQSFLRERVASESFVSACYIVPSRALIAQVTDSINSWKQEDGRKDVAIVNVPLPDDVELPPRAIYVLTQERAHAILAAHPSFSPDVVICDEAQNIQDGSRGILLQGVIDRLIERNSDAQLVFAGPNIKNLHVFADTFGISDVREVRSQSPSVIQNMIIVNTRSAIKGELAIERLLDGNRQYIGRYNIGRVVPTTVERLVWVSERFGQEKPSIIYANRPVDAEKVAKGLAQVLPPPIASARLMDLADFVRVAVHAKYDLADCLERGVGFHYGRIPALVRRGVEEAFAHGEIKFLVTTSTLIQGVNFPAANLFVCKPKKGNVAALTGAEFWNLAGRAGRLGKEFQGNVFLIDYDEWSNKPAEEANEIQVESFLESSLLNSIDQIEECALRDPIYEGDGVADIESAFSRLLSDLVNGRLPQTLAKYDVSEEDRVRLTSALSTARAKVSLPWSVLGLSPTVSALRQQRLADYLHAEIVGGGIKRLEQLIPRNPRDGDSYKILSDIYRICHQQIWTLTAPKLHMRMAAISLSWMRGDPLPEIIEENHRRIGGNLSSNIRTTLNDIEQEVRFKYLRLIICYISILSHVLRETKNDDYLKGISSLSSYMEIGASDQTMISFINIGLSRLTARTLTDELIDKNMGLSEVLAWLRAQNLDDLVSSEIIRNDVRRALLNVA